MGENLYSLSQEFAVLEDRLIEAEGVLDEELEAILDSMNLAITKKVEGIVRWDINLAGDEKAIDDEIARLQAMKRPKTNLRGRLKAYIKECMVDSGIQKKDFGIFSVRIQKNPPSVEVIDEALIPERFIVTIPESYKVDKKAVLDALKKGEDISGVQFITNKTHLRIK